MRKIRIGFQWLRFVAGHTERIDALAFAILIKQARINSVITSTSIRKLKSELRVGESTIRRCVANGLRYGLLRKDGCRLIANRLHDQGERSYLVKRIFLLEQKNRSKRKILTLSGVRTIIEEALFVNQVHIIKDCSDTHKRATNGGSVTKIRNARRRESMLSNKSFNDKFVGLSNKRIQKLIGRKLNKAISCVKSAIRHKSVVKKVREIPFWVKGETYGPVMRAAMQGTNVIVWVQAHCARIRLSNTYLYNGSVISPNYRRA